MKLFRKLFGGRSKQKQEPPCPVRLGAVYHPREKRQENDRWRITAVACDGSEAIVEFLAEREPHWYFIPCSFRDGVVEFVHV